MLNTQMRKEVDRIESILSILTQGNLERNSEKTTTLLSDLSSLSSYYSEIKATQLEKLAKLLKMIFYAKIRTEDLEIDVFASDDEAKNPKLLELLIKFYNIAGVQLFNEKMHNKAEKSLNEGLRLANKHGNHQLVIRISSNLAHVYYHQKQFKKCAKMFEIAATLEEVEQEKIDFLNSAFIVLKEVKEFERAANVLKSLIKLLKSSSDLSTIPKIEEYIDIQLILANKNYKESKESTYDSISEITNLIPILGKEKYAHVYYEIGKLCHLMDNIVDAIDYFFESYQLTSLDNEPIIHAKSALRLAMGYFQVEEYSKAKELLDEASNYSVKTNDLITLKKIKKLNNSLNKSITEKKNLDEKVKNLRDDVIQKGAIQEISTIKNAKVDRNEKIEHKKVSLTSEKTESRDEVTEELGFESYYISLSSKDEKRDNSEILPMEDVEIISSEDMTIEDSSDLSREENISIVSNNHIDTVEYLPESVLQSLSFSEEVQDISPPTITFESARNTISSFLRNNGYNVSYNRHVEGFTGTVDLVAVKGSVRKKKIFLLISSTASDAGLSSYLLQGIIDKGLKVIFILDDESPGKIGNVNLISDINNLEKLNI